MLTKYLTKADIVLFIILMILGGVSSAYFSLSENSGQTVVIESDKKPYATYSLSEDKRVVVTSKNGTNTVVIEDGKVYVTDSSCKNQVCVKHTAISRSGESIVCLPNKLVVSIEGKEGDGPDVVSG